MNTVLPDMKSLRISLHWKAILVIQKVSFISCSHIMKRYLMFQIINYLFPESEYFPRSGCYITTIPIECNNSGNTRNTTNNSNVNCTQINNLKSMSMQFLYNKHNLSQYYNIWFYDSNGNVIPVNQYPYGLTQFSRVLMNQFFPKHFLIEVQKYKPSAYWTKKSLFIYIINAQNSWDEAILITNTLSVNNWTHSWTNTRIKGFKGMVFTSAFW